jgi:dTMP kinase
MTSALGFFVTIEGIEGSGKSALANALQHRLTSSCSRVLVTREPGGTAIGDVVRRILLDCKEVSDRAELLLFEAARAQHIEEIIKPALGRGDLVICDRYIDSTIAYQGYGRGIDFAIIERVNNFATKCMMPNLTILLDLPVQVGLARQTKVDRISAQGLEFHESVRRGYLDLAEADPERFVIINAARSFEEVLDEAAEIIATKAKVKL